MTETAKPEDYTPAELAREIAGIIRDTERWEQGEWFYQPGWASVRNEEDGLFHLVPIAVESLRESLVPGAGKCGSTACVAGWAAILTSPPGTVIEDSCNLLLPGAAYRTTLERQGADALGLGIGYKSDWLFSGARSKAEVLAALDAIAAGEDWSPGGFDGLADEDEDE